MRAGTRAAAILMLAALLGAPVAGAQTAGTPGGSQGGAPPPAPAEPAPAAEAPAKQAPPPADKFRSKTGELRAAVLIGAPVTNDQKQTIGTLSDILMNQDLKVTSAVLSVGGFLGVGSRLVVVPFSNLHIEGDRIILPGATKVSLENLSAYQAGG